MMRKLVFWLAIGLAGLAYVAHREAGPTSMERRDLALRQFEDSDAVPVAIREEYLLRYGAAFGGAVAWAGLGLFWFHPVLRREVCAWWSIV